jgi:DNA repair exonuclease SbcCD ATPase subunit
MELKSDARVNCCGPQNRGVRVIWPAVILAALAAALPANTMSDAFTTRANDLLQKLQLKINDLGREDAEGFQQRIVTLQAEAGALDELQTKVDKEKERVDPLEMDYRNSQSRADGLQQKYESDQEDTRARLESIGKQQRSICNRLGGSWELQDGEWTCMFKVSCRVDHQEACQAQYNSLSSAFKQQAEPLGSQARAIVNQLEDEKQQAEAEAKEAEAKRQAWETEKSKLDELKRGLPDKETNFENAANRFESDLDSAKTTHIQPKLGPAFGQAGAVNGEDKGKCFDTGCAPVITARPDGSLDVPAVQGVPAALAGNAGYKKLHEDIVNLTQQYNDASQKLTAAEKNPQTKPDELQALVKEVSQINSELIIKQYRYKGYTFNLAPTPAATK